MKRAAGRTGVGAWTLAIAGLVGAALAGCRPLDEASAQTPRHGEFQNPERVTIAGYADHAMEPSISRDGRILFFNNSNDPAVDTNLHWAERVDDVTFRYRGEIAGANTTALDGVASMDRDGLLYFVSTRSYDRTASTLYRATFVNGAATGVELVPGISRAAPGIVNFDAEISPDGNALYFVESRFGSNGQPETADILLAVRSGTGFTRPARGAALLHAINTPDRLEYAPAISASGLEIFFTRLDPDGPAIFVADRPSADAPFGPPRRVPAISGFVEAPSLSPDERSLYYHRRDGGLHVICRVTRPY